MREFYHSSPRPIDRRNGLLASADTPRSEIEVRTFVAPPPRYAACRINAGLPHPPDEVSFLHPGQAPPVGLGAGPAGPMLTVNRPVRSGCTSPRPSTRFACCATPRRRWISLQRRPQRRRRSARPPSRLVRGRSSLPDRLPLRHPLASPVRRAHLPGEGATPVAGLPGVELRTRPPRSRRCPQHTIEETVRSHEDFSLRKLGKFRDAASRLRELFETPEDFFGPRPKSPRGLGSVLTDDVVYDGQELGASPRRNRSFTLRRGVAENRLG